MKRHIVLVAALLAVACAQPAAAEGSKFKLYGMLAYVAPLSESDEDLGGVTEAVKASSEVGYSIGVEFMAGTIFGLEFDYLYAKHDIEGDVSGVLGETTFQPISGTLNLHVPLGTLDLHGGPTVAYVNWGDLKVPSGGTDIAIDPEVALGLTAGADVNLAPSLAVTGGLRWLNLKAEPTDGGDALDVNPLFARVGLALKF